MPLRRKEELSSSPTRYNPLLLLGAFGAKRASVCQCKREGPCRKGLADRTADGPSAGNGTKGYSPGFCKARPRVPKSPLGSANSGTHG